MGAGPFALVSIPCDERPDITVRQLLGSERRRLLEADRIVVAGFRSSSTLQAYQPGRMLPSGLPMVLSATEQGAPLYWKLGFETAIRATWWRSGKPG